MFVVKTDCRMFIESAPTVEIMMRNPWTKQVRVRFKVSLHSTNNLGEGSHKDFLCDGDLNFKDKKRRRKRSACGIISNAVLTGLCTLCELGENAVNG